MYNLCTIDIESTINNTAYQGLHKCQVGFELCTQSEDILRQNINLLGAVKQSVYYVVRSQQYYLKRRNSFRDESDVIINNTLCKFS